MLFPQIILEKAAVDWTVYIALDKVKIQVANWDETYGRLEMSPETYHAWEVEAKTAADVVKHVEKFWFPQIRYRHHVDPSFRKRTGLPDHGLDG